MGNSKRLAYLLRHDKNYLFDEHGWREVDDLIKNHGYTIEELNKIVETNNKQRFEFSEDKKYIRARQGHSVDVDVELEEKTPPDLLFHGTAKRFLDSIMRNGICNRTRKYVHLSIDITSAMDVGSRHGKPVVLVVDAKQMATDGIKFHLSRNGICLTRFVDTKYIKVE